MLAKDIMTTRVVTVLENTPIEEVARTLLKWRISAVPVVDPNQRLAGIVSEGDLLLRPEPGSDRSWWLSNLLEPEARARRYAQAHGRLAKDVMTTSVITAKETDTLAKLAAMLEEHRIKRVPVLRRGQLVGIVSRANLLHGLAAAPDLPTPAAARTAPAPKPSAPDDPAIRATILNALHNEINVPGAINVIVSNGVVDLWGGVETEAQRQAVRSVAENAPGVVAVKDHLSVLPAAFRQLLHVDESD